MHYLTHLEIKTTDAGESWAMDRFQLHLDGEGIGDWEQDAARAAHEFINNTSVVGQTAKTFVSIFYYAAINKMNELFEG